MSKTFEHVSSGLEKVLGASLRRAPAGESAILAWPIACGQAVAYRTRALTFEQGILRVQVPDKAWRSELQALAPQYLAIINRYAAENVSRIEFVIA